MSLKRKPVQKVEVDPPEDVPNFQEGLNHFWWLNPVNGKLYYIVEVLDPEADASYPQRSVMH